MQLSPNSTFIDELMKRLTHVKVSQKTSGGAPYRTKSGEARYYLRYWYIDPKDGHRVRWKIDSDVKGLPLASEAQAFALALQIEEEIGSVHNPYKYQPTYKNLWAFARQAGLWLAHVDGMVKGDHLSPKTAGKYRSHVENYFIPHFGQKDIKEIHKFHLTEFLKRLPELRAELVTREIARKRVKVDRAGEAAAISLKTQKDIMDTLATFFNYCAGEELLSKADIPPFPKIRIPNMAPRWTDQEGQYRVLKEVEDRHKDMVEFNILHGFRNGEACALCVKDINLSTNGIRLFHAKTKNEHWVPIHPRAIEMLRQRCAGRLPTARGFTYQDRFGAEHSYTVQSLYKITKAAIVAAGIGDMKPYELFKHSKLTQAGQCGASVEQIAQYAGWGSTAMAKKYVDSNVRPLQIMHRDNVVELPCGPVVAPRLKIT